MTSQQLSLHHSPPTVLSSRRRLATRPRLRPAACLRCAREAALHQQPFALPSLAGAWGGCGDAPHRLQLVHAATGSDEHQQPQQPRPLEGSGGPEQPHQQAAPPQAQDSAGVRAALAMLRWYKSVLSPQMASTCRFLPTCSTYAMDAYRAHGVAKGTVLTAWRLLRCNPWGPSGYDPVQWPPPGLPPSLFVLRGSAEVAVLLGAALLLRLSHALLFE